MVLDASEPIAEGTLVTVQILEQPDREPTFAELFEDIAGKAVGLPPDMAENHDHYVHGLPNVAPRTALRDRLLALQHRFISPPYDGSEVVDQRRESGR